MKQVAILGTALVASLALAWSVYTTEDVERDDTAVPLYADPGEALTRIAWEDENGTVIIDERTDARGEYLWVQITEEVPVAEPMGPDFDPDSDSGDPPQVQTELVTRAFRGNVESTQLWADYSPLYAIRELTDGGMLEAYGFEDSESALIVTIDGADQRFTVGGETFGAKDRYVSGGDRIFLVDDATLRPVIFAKTRLVERGLIPYLQPEIASIELSVDGRSATWVQHNRDDRGAHYWAPEGSPDEASDAAKSWMRKLLGVRSQSYLREDDLDVAVEPVLTYTVHGDNDAFAVEVLREVTEGDNPRWFARSEHARSLVELTRSLATDAFVDVEAVLPR